MSKTGLLVFYLIDYRVHLAAASMANPRRRLNFNLERELVPRLRTLPRRLTHRGVTRLIPGRTAPTRPNQGM